MLALLAGLSQFLVMFNGDLFLCIILMSTASALNFNPNSIKGMAHAYGFVFAQQNSLNLIVQNDPRLGARADLVQLQFNSTFPDILPKLEKQLKAALGDKDFQEMKHGLQLKLRNLVAKQEL
jgi:hypothetical protein